MTLFSHPSLLAALSALPVLSLLAVLATRRRQRHLIAMGGLVAEEYKGKAKSVDADKGVITVTVKDGDSTKDVDIKVNDSTKILYKDKEGNFVDLPDGWKSKRWEKMPAVVVTVTSL